ncbi:MAG: hypothetical protein HFG05_03920 [Oscillibacter sp.]|nr:hypothetical protein [Oscillibacter sp.]
MPEKCTDTSRDCSLVSRVDALERANEQHSATHREMFDRLRVLETLSAVQENKLDTILNKLDALTGKVEGLEAKPAKRWEGLVEKALWAVCAAVIAFLLGRVGL